MAEKIVVKSNVRKETILAETISVEPEPTGEEGKKWILTESAFDYCCDKRL